MPVFSCAYKHSGNGIIERNHRTIKRMVARTGGSVEDMVFWYNQTPNSSQVVPAAKLYQYEARLPGQSTAITNQDRERAASSNPYQVGTTVFVKPGNARCDTVWREGVVTRLISDTVVEVDGTNRHIADVRHKRLDTGSACS